MLANDDIQAGLVQYLKAKVALTALLTGGAADVREDQWQGTTFTYPAVRVSLDTQFPFADCNKAKLTFSVLCFSEKDSSQEADSLAGVVNDLLHKKAFTSNSIRFILYSNGLIPAIRQDHRTWRSEATFRATVEPVSR